MLLFVNRRRFPAQTRVTVSWTGLSRKTATLLHTGSETDEGHVPSPAWLPDIAICSPIHTARIPMHVDDQQTSSNRIGLLTDRPTDRPNSIAR